MSATIVAAIGGRKIGTVMPTPGTGVARICSDRADGDRGEHTGDPDAMPEQQIERERAGNEGAADIDRHDRAGPINDLRHDVDHAVDDYLPARQNLLLRELEKRDIHVAAEQRCEQQQCGGAPSHSQPHVGQPQHADLDQRDQRDEEGGQYTERERGKRQIIEMSVSHHRGPISSSTKRVLHRSRNGPPQASMISLTLLARSTTSKGFVITAMPVGN